ncbi:50S ribosomal protein L25/general stress protein Ctc [Arthrobacter sp. H14]|uniref:50S ribosomal protein L25/general stress protein Ctc n=1 Tax=Arthrobacter sp. H14 TaxID=1312959 RepID=UPI00047BEBFD|nr:50S ribosomal protein L25/general stress protein Ctc [Arthrobacter sp. H14]
MSEQKLPADLRTEFGKGAARRLRRAEKIPAVIYGHGADVIHVALPEKETTLAVRTPNALLRLDIHGDEHLTLAKDVQRDPVRQIVEHLDLLAVKRGEKVTVEVGVVIIGEATPGIVINLEAATVTVEAEATHLPSHLDVNITGHDVGDHVHASDIILPKGVTLLTEEDTLVVNVASPTVQDLGEGEEAEETEEGENAEGEGEAKPESAGESE